jgi:glycosyltransferase involved in cell wall biosynthesis
MARVSIIIPTHNRAPLLRRAIESAKLAGSDLEIIVVDDASTDETASMCEELAGVILVRLDRNVGQAAARNVGILRSTGEFLAFLDDDDLRIAGSVDKQVELLTQDERLALVYGPTYVGHTEWCVPTGEIRPPECPAGDIFWDLLKGNFIYTPSVLVRRQHLQTVGMFDPKATGTEDWDLWIRLAEMHAVGVLDEPVAIYREYTASSGQTSSNRPKMCRSSAYTLLKALESPRAQKVAAAERRRIQSDYLNVLWHNLTVEGRYALSKNHFRYAVHNYVTAVRLNPRRACRLGAIRSLARDLMNVHAN